MKHQIRWPFDGPEPPPSVRRLGVGDYGYRYAPSPWPRVGGHHVFFSRYGQWRRWPCKRQCHDIHFPGKTYPTEHYHWFNGDRSRPWDRLASWTSKSYAIDLDAMRRMRSKPKRKRGRGE